MADDAITVARGDARHPTATIATDPDTLNTVLWGDRPLGEAPRSRAMTVEGDRAAVDRFVRLFPVPHPGTAVSA